MTINNLQTTKELFSFELKYILRLRSYWMILILFSIWGSLLVTHPYFNVGLSFNNVISSVSIVLGLGALTVAIPLFVATFVVGSIIRDKELFFDQILFVMPMKSINYLIGRFLAGVFSILLVFLGAALGIYMGQFMPWVEQQVINSHSIYPYIYAFCFLIIPNILFICSLLVLIASATRSLRHVFLGIIFFYIIHSLSGVIISDTQLVHLFDPFGIKAFFNFHYTLYSNEQLKIITPILSESLIINRLFWGSVSLTLFLITFFTFKIKVDTSKENILTNRRVNPNKKLLPYPKQYNPKFNFYSQWLNLSLFDIFRVVKSIPFKVVLVISLISLVGSIFEVKDILETRNYLTSSTIVNSFNGIYIQLLVIIMIFFAGELLFQEREHAISPITEVLPVTNITWFLSKLSSLFGLLISFLVFGVLTLVVLLFIMGKPIDLTILVYNACIQSLRPLIFGFTTLSILVLLNNKTLGYFFMAAILATQSFISGSYSKLFLVAKFPNLYYSDFYGFGYSIYDWYFFVIYWLIVSILFASFCITFWNRGDRVIFVKKIKQQFNNRPYRLVLPLFFILITFSLFSWHLKKSTSYDEYKVLAANYEHIYKEIEQHPQPEIIGINTNIDIYPERRLIEANIKYTLENKFNKPIKLLYIDYPIGVSINLEKFTFGRIKEHNEHMGILIIELEQSLLPSHEVTVDFSVLLQIKMKSNTWAKNQVQSNGSFFTSTDFFPQLGYNHRKELSDENDRMELGLTATQLKPANIDSELFIGGHFNVINFEATISTNVKQLALTTGVLLNKWVSNERNYFHYKSQELIVPLIPFFSADYKTTSVKANDTLIELYFNENHFYNNNVIKDYAKFIFEFYEDTFSAYGSSKLKIVEFPNQFTLGQSFSNIIAISESSGFLKNIDDRKESVIDRLFFVLAHEISHQWWAYKLTPSKDVGSTSLIESLAQYSALIAIEKYYGIEYMKRILLDEQSRYFSSRNKHEEALIKSNSPYVSYNKGGLVLYKLRNLVGDKELNKILKKLLINSKKRPFINIKNLTDLLSFSFKKHRSLIIELFEQVIIYDNKILEAKATLQNDGSWLINASIQFQQIDKHGNNLINNSKYIPSIKLNVFTDSSSNLSIKNKDDLIQSTSVKANNSIIDVSLIVQKRPNKIIIDPLYLFLDKNIEDNMITIKIND